MSGEGRGHELLATIVDLEVVQLFFVGGQPLGASFGLFFLASKVDVVHELFVSLIATDAVFFALSELNCAQGSKVLRVLWNFNKVFRLRAVRNRDFALLPHSWNVRLPSLAHAFDETIRATQQQNVRPQGVAAG